MSWSIKISGVETTPDSVNLTHRVRDLDSFNVNIPNSNEIRDWVGYKNTVDIYYRGSRKMIGRCDRPRYGDRTIKIFGKEMANELFDQIIDIDQGQDDTKIIKYRETGANGILTEFLGLKGWSLASTEPTDTMSIELEYENIYEGVKAVADFLDKDFWFQWISEGSKYCHFSGNRGRDRGEIIYDGIGDKEEDHDGIENDIEIYYMSPSDASLSIHITDAASIATYGSKSAYYTTTKGIDASTVRRLANALLEDKKDPIISIPIKISTQYMYDSNLIVGDDITLNIPHKKIEGSYEIKKMTVGTVTTSIDTSNEREDIADVIKTLKQDSELRYRSRKTCVYTCQVACQDQCLISCEGDPCQTSCQTGCETTCETSCQTSCKSGCQISCQTGCMLQCQTGCETSCQTGCETTCETGCQVTCETGCETSCETGCLTTCEALCQSCCEWCGMACFNKQAL